MWKEFISLHLGVVSLTFHKLSKTFFSKFMCCRSRTYENFKLNLLHVYKVSAWNSDHKCDFHHCISFLRLFWRAHQTLVEQPPAPRNDHYGYLNQCCLLDTLEHTSWNFNQNTMIFIQGNQFQNIVCKMVTILYTPQCVKISQAWRKWNWITIKPSVHWLKSCMTGWPSFVQFNHQNIHSACGWMVSPFYICLQKS